jgi:TolB-like protein/Tfp pilus assembly protein PilF
MIQFFAELKRRNVLRVGAAYVASAWLLIQVAQTLFPLFGLGPGAVRIVVVILAIGFVPTLIVAWAFELTPQGWRREKDVDRATSIASSTGRKLDRVIMAVLAVALAYFAFDKFVLSPQREAVLQKEKIEAVEAARREGRSAALVESYGDKSIAVLPFVDMSPGTDQEYFSDGISEELLNLLARIEQLRVISRSSSFSFKGQNLGISEIASRLNVAHVLEGSVRKAGNRVRITAQLIDARSDTHLWSETYDRPLDDIFAVQDEIAAAVVGQLKLKLLGAAPKVEAKDPRAYALVLQARQVGRQNSPNAFARAIALYQQAIEIDPDEVDAWNGLARHYMNQAYYGLRPIEEGARLAREAASKALASDRSYAPAYARLGMIASDYEGDLAAAARYLEQALALEPTNVDILSNAAMVAQSLGRLDTAIALNEFVAARDPMDAISHANLAMSYYHAGRTHDALASYRVALGLSPDYGAAHYGIGIALLLEGDGAGALAAIQQEVHDIWRMIGMPMALHATGDEAGSRNALTELISKFEKDAAYNIAYVLAFRNELDRAFEWLDRAAAIRDPGLSEIAVQRLFRSLHHDPRWLSFLRKIGRAPEHLSAIEFDVRVPQ